MADEGALLPELLVNKHSELFSAVEHGPRPHWPLVDAASGGRRALPSGAGGRGLRHLGRVAALCRQVVQYASIPDGHSSCPSERRAERLLLSRSGHRRLDYGVLHPFGLHVSILKDFVHPQADCICRHSAEIPLIFNSNGLWAPGAHEEATSTVLGSRWLAFARDGIPGHSPLHHRSLCMKLTSETVRLRDGRAHRLETV